MKIVVTLEARMASSRLPGKVLLEAKGKPMLEHLLSRLKKVTIVDDIILATTTENSDDILESWAAENSVACFRGSTLDVMGRVIGAAKSVNADVVVEITGDCPIIDPELVELSIQTFLSNSVDYVSNAHIRSYPDGMDVQVFRLETLEKSYMLTNDPLDHEHVTRHIRLHPEIFSSINIIAPRKLRWPDLGLTLDEYQDYMLLTKIIENFSSHQTFGCQDVLDFLRENPSLIEMNRFVVRKGLHP